MYYTPMFLWQCFSLLYLQCSLVDFSHAIVLCFSDFCHFFLFHALMINVPRRWWIHSPGGCHIATSNCIVALDNCLHTQKALSERGGTEIITTRVWIQPSWKLTIAIGKKSLLALVNLDCMPYHLPGCRDWQWIEDIMGSNYLCDFRSLSYESILILYQSSYPLTYNPA